MTASPPDPPPAGHSPATVASALDRVTDLPLDQTSLATVADPTRAHRFMSSYLPDLGGRSTAIRADTGTQFRIDLPNDPLGVPGHIRLRLRGPVLTNTSGAAEPVTLTESTRLVAVVAAERRNTDSRGIRVRPVRDDEATQWAYDLLTRHGLTPTELAVTRGRRFGANTGVRFTIRDLAATVTVTDPVAASRALHQGIGRGRAYGLGMLVPMPATSVKDTP